MRSITSHKNQLRIKTEFLLNFTEFGYNNNDDNNNNNNNNIKS